MPIVRGCNLPDELLYDVDNHIWIIEQDDGNLKIGMTAVAVALAGELVAFTPKKIGKKIKPGRSCAIVESGKWVGPAKTKAGGEIVAVNEALVNQPNLANADPYANWMVVLAPDDWDNVKGEFTPGSEVAAPYEAKMDEDGFDGCG